ncbi:hypothetical protein GCU72_06180 [Vibrio sp. B1Z05]|nr:hypothetical protein [Vibrio sp. B1Z05]
MSVQKQQKYKRKTPRAFALRGYDLTCSNPATKSAPCIYSMISMLILSLILSRLPSGVQSPILADQYPYWYYSLVP